MLLQLVVTLQMSRPPRSIPEEMQSDYTLAGSIPIEDYYVDDSNDGLGTHYQYTLKGMTQMIDGSLKAIKKIIENIQYLIKVVPEASIKYLSPSLTKNQWVMLALLLPIDHDHQLIETFDRMLVGKKTAVFGSNEPWIEATLIALGADSVTVIEYNKLTYDHDKIKHVSYDDFPSFYSNTSTELASYDIAMSISSFDHTGLGRYNDPLDANGDINDGMNRAMQLLKEGGLLYLTVPIGPDLLVWNLLRRYGPIRLPLLLEHWELVDRIGWNDGKLVEEGNYRQAYEPVLILRKPVIVDVCDQH